MSWVTQTACIHWDIGGKSSKSQARLDGENRLTAGWPTITRDKQVTGNDIQHDAGLSRYVYNSGVHTTIRNQQKNQQDKWMPPNLASDKVCFFILLFSARTLHCAHTIPQKHYNNPCAWQALPYVMWLKFPVFNCGSPWPYIKASQLVEGRLMEGDGTVEA